MSLFQIHPDIAKAKTIPTDFYLKQEYYEMAKEKIFAHSWQFVGDTDQVREQGWMTPVNLLEGFLDEPLVLSRDKENKLHCLSNVCTHRGNLLVERPCKSFDIRCKYHGRRFQLNGQFFSMPEFKEVEDFPTEEDNLTKLPLYKWGKWLFTSLVPDLPSKEYFREMTERVPWLPFDDYLFRPDLSRDYLVDANWALYCENYLEGFHIPFVHAGLNAVIDYSSYTTEIFKYSNLQIGLAKGTEPVFDIPEGAADHGKQVAGYYFWVFPNLMFNFYPWGLSLNVVTPLATDKCKVSFLAYVCDESKLRQGAGANLHQVELEDEDVVRHVQKGIRSRFYNQGRYSVKMEKGTHHFHRLLDEFLSR